MMSKYMQQDLSASEHLSESINHDAAPWQHSALHNSDMLNCDTLHSACYIDENGKEIPITRSMIDRSCE